MRVITWLACLTWAAHCTAARASGLAADWCLLDHEERVGFYNKKLTVYNCPSASPLLLIPFLWSPVKINIQCPTPRVLAGNPQNAVYVAPDMPSLLSATKNKDAAWCGWEGLMDRRVCRLQLSAFTHTMLGVEADQGDWSARPALLASHATFSNPPANCFPHSVLALFPPTIQAAE
eukprot:scaffold5756_cov19-Tisochrysis_lutea.AAC.1